MAIDRRTHERHVMRFVRLLGWSPVRLYTHRFPVDGGPASGLTVRWIESGDRETLVLHVNFGEYSCAAVYALRYRIVSGWHRYVIRSEAAAAREAKRLAPWLAFDRFATPEARREFRRLHPECAGYSWFRVRTQGLPRSATGA